MLEPDLERAQRQVMRGAVLIERLRTLIDDLRVAGHAMLADRAEEMFGELLVIQAEHIVELQKLSGQPLGAPS